ncbi:DUF1349 domain-containing protein [Aggregatilinea lenta]|uniref:DUF1349 domain-containing protein n=1 Tax=Aggregatilinea lenta TaxID=913108 RepID=UPI000E5B6B5C|nr:DUF1349 domain-containing protein [Aggregatilinea lenta]
MHWFNEPPHWSEENGTLTVTTGPKTDFWRKTHYGFVRDNGHVYGETVSGNFVAEVKVAGQYHDLYDQAGLMIRQDESHWLKCGIEFVEGVQHASAVATNEHSDWSVVPLAGSPSAIWLRVKRSGDAVEVHYSLGGADYIMLRLAYLPEGGTVQVGPMCCSPDGDGFSVTFENFTVRPIE